MLTGTRPIPWYVVAGVAFRELATAVRYAAALEGRQTITIKLEVQS